MILTRWKAMAGVLGLSLGGLAAMAECPDKTPRKSAEPQKSSTCPECQSCPACPTKNQSFCPSSPAVDVTIPPLQLPGESQPVSSEVPTLPVSNPPPLPPLTQVPPPPMPVVRDPKMVEPAPAPRPAPQVVEFAIPMTTEVAQPVVPVAAPTRTIPPMPVELPKPELLVQPVQTSTSPVQPSMPVPPRDTAPPMMPEKKLRVMLNMGDDRPRFEVRDGEEPLLKVLCEKVDVKSPSDRGETMSTLKAVGKVSFVMPGGEGTCDELSVVPGSGQVVVSGKVTFRYNWGKVETEVTGERMTFRLGSSQMIPGSGSSTIPASYQRR